MQKKLVYFSVLLLFIACSLIACHREPAPVRRPYYPPYFTPSYKNCRILEMDRLVYSGGVDSVFNFYVNSSGRLDSIGEYVGYNQHYNYALTYDSSGHLVKVTSPFNNVSTTFSYTSDGLLSEIDGRQADSVRRRFVYSSSTIPDKCIEYTYVKLNNTWDSIEHRYTVQNGNIVMIEAFKGGAFINQVKYDYDTTILNFNKTYSLISQFVVSMGLFEEVQPFNKNALKKKTPALLNKYLGVPYYISYQMDSIIIMHTDLSWLSGAGNADTVQRESRNFQYHCE